MFSEDKIAGESEKKRKGPARNRVEVLKVGYSNWSGFLRGNDRGEKVGYVSLLWFVEGIVGS